MSGVQAWLPVLTAIIAAVATLSGVLLSNLFGRRERVLERSFQAYRESNEFLLRRGEDLFVFIDRFDRYVAGHVDLIERYCHGHIDLAGFKRERGPLLVTRGELEFARIQLSVHAYFNAILPFYEEAMTHLRHLATLDGVLAEASNPTSSTIYKISEDASRLRWVSQNNGKAIRLELAQIVRAAFDSGRAPGGALTDPAANPLDPAADAR